MYRIKPYSANEWVEVERQGFLRFYQDYVLDSLVLGLALFAIMDLILNFGQQTELMTVGYLVAVIFPPISGVLLWQFLKGRFKDTPLN